jgi:hypothetical protein
VASSTVGKWAGEEPAAGDLPADDYQPKHRADKSRADEWTAAARGYWVREAEATKREVMRSISSLWVILM